MTAHSARSGSRSSTTGRDRSTTWTRRLAAELFGTFALTFVAAGADVAGRLSGGEVGAAARAAAPALLIAAMIYALGDVSRRAGSPRIGWPSSAARSLRRSSCVGSSAERWKLGSPSRTS